VAVIRKATDFEDTITLDDGQVVAVKLRRSGFDVGDQEALVEAAGELPFLQKRMEKLSALIEAAESNEEYEMRMAEYKGFVKKMGTLMRIADMTIKSLIVSWDLCATEEDEKAGRPIPLTPEALSTLDESLRMDVFLKITERLKTRSEQEKKDSSATSQNGSQTPKQGKGKSRPSMPDISSLSGTESDLNPSSAGVSMSSTKPS